MLLQEILNLDTLCENEDWLISTDLAGNKREKSDLELKNYSISLKKQSENVDNERS